MTETATKSVALKFPQFFEKFGNAILESEWMDDHAMVVVDPSQIRQIVAFLKKENRPRFEVMMDLFAMDYLKFPKATRERFAVIYNLYSITEHDRIFIKCFLPESAPEIDTITGIYQAANWFEREAWDLFGVQFKGHPNLTRILCHNEFVGHPLRKDYPADKYQQLRSAIPSEGL